MRDELVDLELAVEVVADEAGELRAALDAAKGASLPHAARDELERWLLLALPLHLGGEETYASWQSPAQPPPRR